jgi:hypothetical protein
MEHLARRRTTSGQRQRTAMASEMLCMFVRTGAGGGISRARPAIMFILYSSNARAYSQQRPQRHNGAGPAFDPVLKPSRGNTPKEV